MHFIPKILLNHNPYQMILLENTQCLIIYYLFYFHADSIHIFHVYLIIVSYFPPVPIGSPSSHSVPIGSV